MQRAAERPSVAGAGRAGKAAAGAGRAGKAAAGALSQAAMIVFGAGLRFGLRRPAFVLTSLAVMGGAGFFAWNATMKQTVRHPAPLLASAKPPLPKADQLKHADSSSPATTGTVPVPPARPSGPDAIGSIIRTSEGPAEAKPRTAETRPKVAEAKPAAAAPAEAKRTAQPRVASAQKALAKLGYGPITADGLLGSGTRSALEKFERDKKLPVTGDLSPKTVKQLASLSGIAIR